MITSPGNAKVKRVAQLGQKARARKEEDAFVAEGRKMFLEAPPADLREVYVSDVFWDGLRRDAERGAADPVWERLQGCPLEVVSDAVFRKMADTKTPQGILCVLRRRRCTWEELLHPEAESRNAGRDVANARGMGMPAAKRQEAESRSAGDTRGAGTPAAKRPEAESRSAGRAASGRRGAGNQQHALPKEPLWLVLEDIQDPGNLGTMLRAGEGAGVTGVILSGASADIYNPKAIRATMGSLYRVPFLYVDDLRDALLRLRREGAALYAAQLRESADYDAYDYTGKTAFLIGNEGNGLRPETLRLADAFLRIPMLGQVESLNAAIAASILLYEAAGQRRRAGKERSTQ